MNRLTGENISFRFAIREDASALSELGKQTFYEAFAPFNTKEDMLLYSSRAFALQQVEKELREEHTWFLLVVDAGLLIGYARLRRNSHEALQGKRSIEIERFYISEAYTGRHIGSLLMQQCLNYAKQQHHQVVWLGVWEHNHRALAFYKKWGFIQFGSHPFLLGNDLQTDLLMKLSLE